MGSPSCLADTAVSVVIDTSVAINLTACGHAADLLRVLPNGVVAVDTVPAEMDEGRRLGRRHADLLNDLVSLGLIEIVKLDSPALAIFESLVTGRAAETLDDGEAATIAYASENGAIPIIDERKATRICGERFPALRIGCTVDLFAHPEVGKALGQHRLSEAVLKSLRLARMRVLPHHLEWVVDLIGREEAALCPSLPRAVRARQFKE